MLPDILSRRTPRARRRRARTASMSAQPPPAHRLDESIARIARNIVQFATAHARLVLGSAALLTVASALYAAFALGINSDTNAMLSEDLPFRQMTKQLVDTFPGLGEPLIVVVDADSPERAREATAALADELVKYPDLFRTVFAPGVGTFFDAHGLLYVDTATLERFSDRVISALPLVSSLARNPTLDGFVGIIEKAFTANDPGRLTPTRVPEMLDAVATILEAPLADSGTRFSWRGWVLGNDEKTARQVILADPVLAFADIKAARRPIAAVRAAVRTIGLGDDPNVRVRITGDAALGTEEMDVVIQQTGILAVVGAIAIVAGLLWLALGSMALVGATVLTLLCGLVWTAGFATLAIGYLNLVSTAFAVLFIGLGVDFGIHLSLRYRDLLDPNAATDREQVLTALHRSGHEVGGSIALCAVTTAIGFFAFVPTRYAGVAELGLISGVGMFLSLLATLTVLPAFVSLVPHRVLRPAGTSVASRVLAGLAQLADRHAGVIVIGATLLAAAAVTQLPEVRFDPDPVRVRDPGTESVQTMTDLLRDSPVAPWTAEIAVADMDQAVALAASLEKLPTVSRAVTLQSFVPIGQDDKLEILDDLLFFLEPALHYAKEPVTATTAAEAETAIHSLEKVLASEIAVTNAAPDDVDPVYLAGLERLSLAVAALRTSIANDADPDGRTGQLEGSLFGDIPRWLDSLGDALQPERISIYDLPASLVARYRSADGHARVEVFPAGDMAAPDALAMFVSDVQTLAPSTAGSAVEIVESGRAIVLALKQAFTGTLLIVALLLMLLWRSVRDTLLVLSALAFAAVLTSASTVVLDLPFNFADVIVLPLLLGVGVDSGIHLLHRHRSGDHDGVLHTSTARGVLFSALTTIASFGTLALSSHPGIASLGVLLTIGLAFVLLANLVFLPALIHWIGRSGESAIRS